MADYAGILDIFTCALLIVAVVEIVHVSKATRIAETQTAVLSGQSDILEKQKEIARLQYFADHRPRIVLKDVFFTLGQECREIMYELVNAGGGKGTVVDGFIGLEFVEDERVFMLGGGLTHGVEGIEALQSGQSVLRGLVVSNERASVLRMTTAPGLGQTDNLFFYGRLVYVDERGQEFGTRRVSVFRRKWDVPSQRFLRTGNPDHEYAD